MPVISCIIDSSDNLLPSRSPSKLKKSSPIAINPDSHSRTTWKSIVPRGCLGTPGNLFKPFGIATWLVDIGPKTLDSPLTFPEKGT
ncbi:hypothetical protein V8E51_012697 [Hyaloscypha variabilis]